MPTIIRNGTLMTGTGTIIPRAEIVIAGNRIVSAGPAPHGAAAPRDAELVDATGRVIIPGFVQTHLHLCQTLFRGHADELELLDWLTSKIFPFEAAHTAESMRLSALLGVTELIRSGTTTILDMGSIRHEEEIIRAVGETGLRAAVGKAMMDVNDLFPPLKESTHDALSSTRELAEAWHNSFNGRITYAAAPRFVLSCSEGLLRGICEMLAHYPGMRLHTHASENRSEIEAVRRRFGMENIEYLDRAGLLSDRACLAHCIHLEEHEVNILKRTGSHVAHCPSSNLKLASGVANVPAMIARGINVTLGADGAPCNNTLDMFEEMRLASLLQKPAHGPRAMPAREVFEMATVRGARALGLEKEIGSIEPGKKADLVLLNLDEVWNPIDPESLYAAIVYSGSPENVDAVMIDGEWVCRQGEVRGIDAGKLRHEARAALRGVVERMQTV